MSDLESIFRKYGGVIAAAENRAAIDIPGSGASIVYERPDSGVESLEVLMPYVTVSVALNYGERELKFSYGGVRKDTAAFLGGGMGSSLEGSVTRCEDIAARAAQITFVRLFSARQDLDPFSPVVFGYQPKHHLPAIERQIEVAVRYASGLK